MSSVDAKLPERRLSTEALQALYPAVVGASLGPYGVYVGLDDGGARFFYDAWYLYEQRICPNPHLLLLGDLRRGKSSLGKTLAFRQTGFGRWAFVLDPKGEYVSLAEARGGTVIRIAPGGRLRVNPFAGLSRREREEILLAVTRATLRRPLEPMEARALGVALDAAGDQALLPDIVNALLWPAHDAHEAIGAGVTTEMLAEAGRAAGLSLGQLVGNGRLAGMFDGPTSPGLEDLRQITVLDLSAIWQKYPEALEIVMMLADGWFRAVVADKGVQGMYIVDEGWALLANLRVAEGLQAGYKLVSLDGWQRVMVMHGITDLDSVGDVGTRQLGMAKGLLRDTGTKVIYYQPASEAAVTADVLRLTGIEERTLGELGTGVGLWKIGDLDGVVVSHRRAKLEEAFTDTDTKMVQRPGRG